MHNGAHGAHAAQKKWWQCLNCKMRFESVEEPDVCPRCNSGHVRPFGQEAPRGSPKSLLGPVEQTQERKAFVHVAGGQRVFGDTKDAWKSFHSSSPSNCPKCGGTEFNRDFKHKEKTCKKCGEISSLRRPQA